MLDAYRTPDRLKARIQMHDRFGNPNFDIHQWLFELLLNPNTGGGPLVPAQADVLEVGAGTGRMWQVAMDRVPRGWRLTLTDRSDGMLAELQRLATQLRQEHGIDATASLADAMRLPFQDASFDLVFANHMLYHVPDPAQGIAELRRVLRPGGLLVAATNGDGHMRQATALASSLLELEGVDLTGYHPLTFTCESGAGQLQKQFADVTLHRHDDPLHVTDAAALVAYLRSLVHLADDVPAATVQALGAWEEGVQRVNLPFTIDRATGVFLARAG